MRWRKVLPSDVDFTGQSCHTFQETRRINGESGSSLKEVIKDWGLLACGKQWAHFLSDPFRSNFVPLRNLIVTILANCEPNRPRNAWNDYCCMLIAEVCKLFWRNWELLSNDYDGLMYKLWQGKDYLFDIVALLILPLKLSKQGEEFKPLSIMAHLKADMNNFLKEVNKSISSFKTDFWLFCIGIIDDNLASISSSNALVTLHQTLATVQQS